MCSFPLKRGVTSIAVTHSKIMCKFFPGPNFVSPEWRCPINRGFPGEVPLQSCPAIDKTHLQAAAGSTCSLLCSLSLTGNVFSLFLFFFFFTKRLDVIFICKNQNKNMPEELLNYHPLSRHRRYYYGHRSQLQMKVKQMPLHIKVQSFTITPISF